MLTSSPGGTSVVARQLRQGVISMSENDLHALIGQLKSEIAQLGPEDHDTRARLESLVTEVEQRIEASDGDDALIERLRDAVERFEVEHPRATGILNNIMVTLGNIGI